MDRNEERLFVEYIQKILHQNDPGVIDRTLLSEDAGNLADALEHLADCVKQTREMGQALADGDIDRHFHAPGNSIAAPLKSVQSNLKNLSWVAGRVAQGDYNQNVRHMGSLTDAFNQMIDELKIHREEVQQQLSTDYLTGCGNRRRFNQVTEALWEQKQKFVLAFIDVDGVKRYNDQFGHYQGDEYILEICGILKEVCRDKGTMVFRLGGDEFMVLTPEASVQELELELDAARKTLRRSAADQNIYFKDFSYGCVEIDPCGERMLTEYISQADRTMYNAKTLHYLQRAQYEQFSPSHKEDELDKSGLESRIFDIFSTTANNRYLYLCNMSTNVSRWSLQAVKDFNLPGEYMFDAGNIWLDYIHPDDREIYMADIAAVFSGTKHYHAVEYRAKNKDGNYVICKCSGGILKGTNGEPDLFAGTITNCGIVDNIDPLTNLYNIYELFGQLRRIRKNHEKARILCVAVNQFADINNVYGYSTGNLILQQLANHLRQLTKGSGLVFRLEGTKFAIILGKEDESLPEELYGSIVYAAQNEINANGSQIGLSVTGAFFYVDHIKTEIRTVVSELLYVFKQAKKEKLGELSIYDSRRSGEIYEELAMMDAVKQSVVNGCRGFFLTYQPQVSAEGKLKGVEALLRWENPEFGLVPPNRYIPFLENDACFYTLGLWIMETAMNQAKGLLKDVPDLQLSINISYRQMEHFGFREDVMGLLHKTGFPAENLVLELTEHCQTMNPMILEPDIHFFKSKNIKISADDFCTGYSSIGLMRNLAFDCIKIERVFIMDILKNRKDQIIVSALIDVAHAMGMQVCVEGIETEEQMEFVKQCKAEWYQGYHVAKPLPYAQLKEYVNVHKNPLQLVQ